MTDTIDTLSTKRRYMLIGVALASALWQLPSLDMLSGYGSSIAAIKTLGVLAWIIGIIALLMIQKRMASAHTDSQAALEDELVKSNRLMALKYGYIILLGMSAVLFAACHIIEPTGKDVARILLVTGVCAPLFAFAGLER